MTSHLRTTGVLLALALVAGLAGEAARADEDGAAAPGVWVFDVRIVRVDPAVPETSEEPFALTDPAGPRTSASWPEILGLLKKRGRTTILLDQRVTALTARKARIQSERQVPMLALNQEDKNNTIKRSATLKTGCTAELTATDDELDYRVEARWALGRAAEGHAPPQMTTSWAGCLPALAGGTLVLGYREQIPGLGAAVQAVEIYGFVTGRYVEAR